MLGTFVQQILLDKVMLDKFFFLFSVESNNSQQRWSNTSNSIAGMVNIPHTRRRGIMGSATGVTMLMILLNVMIMMMVEMMHMMHMMITRACMITATDR